MYLEDLDRQIWLARYFLRRKQANKLSALGQDIARTGQTWSLNSVNLMSVKVMHDCI